MSPERLRRLEVRAALAVLGLEPPRNPNPSDQSPFPRLRLWRWPTRRAKPIVIKRDGVYRVTATWKERQP